MLAFDSLPQPLILRPLAATQAHCIPFVIDMLPLQILKLCDLILGILCSQPAVQKDARSLEHMRRRRRQTTFDLVCNVCVAVACDGMFMIACGSRVWRAENDQ